MKTVHLGEARVRGSSGSVVSTSASTPQRGVSALNPRRVQGYGEDVGVQRRNSRSNSMRSTRSGRSSEGGAHRASSMNSSRVSEHINTRSARTNSPRVFGGGGTNMKYVEKGENEAFLRYWSSGEAILTGPWSLTPWGLKKISNKQHNTGGRNDVPRPSSPRKPLLDLEGGSTDRAAPRIDTKGG